MIDKTCTGCGNEFQAKSAQQKKCNRNCGRGDRNGARKVRRETHELHFVGVDGEGVNRYDQDGKRIGHDYVLLSVGNRSLYREDGGALGYGEIFEFLYDCYQDDPEAAYVGFFLGYDFTMWLKTLPQERAEMLMTKSGIAKRARVNSGGNTIPFEVEAGDWDLDILGTKRFKLRRHSDTDPKHPWMYICDAGSFFQSSFLTAIDPKTWEKPLLSEAEYNLIRAGKEHRDAAQFDTDMIQYNILENEVLGRLMRTLNEGFSEMGLHLNRNQWFGPGQVASEWLNNTGCPTGEEIRLAVPAEALEACRMTYYGGWFEIFAHGHVPGVSYEYDINSAYPAVIASLPCLLHGTWSSGEGAPNHDLPEGALRVIHVDAKGTDKVVGALPYRTPKGQILRPSRVIGWYWQHEVDAAVAAGVVSKVAVAEWHEYQPCDCPPPLAAIRELYQNRLRFGKNSPKGKAAKLAYNSAYGKLAQSIGSPKFANSIYASLITSGCRTQILEAIASHPNRTRDLLMIATDGIYFSTPHPTLPLSKTELGLWDEEEKHNLTLFMPGVYWDDKSRAKIADGQAPSLKSRGVNAKDLATKIADIDEQFRTGPEWPSTDLTINFTMVTCTQALARGKWDTAGLVTTGDTRTIDSQPGNKRNWKTPDHTHMPKPVKGIRRTSPWSSGMIFGGTFHTTPYNQFFGDEIAEQLSAQGMSVDGSVQDELIWALMRDE